MKRVQALAGISRSALCFHSNETRAPIANPPSTAQLQGIPTIPQVTSGSVKYYGNAARDRQTHYWSRGVAVTSLGISTRLFYVGPG